MVSSSVEIVNSGIIKLGGEPITSLTDQNNKIARAANKQYDILRRELLRSHPWNFAVTRVQLGASSNTPAYEFSKEFVIPSDVLRILEIDSEDFEFRIEHNASDGNRVILTDATTVKIKYIKNITDVSQFDASFVEVLATRIAADLAYTVTDSVNFATTMYELYLDTLSKARTYNAQEGTPNQVTAKLWLNSRF